MIDYFFVNYDKIWRFLNIHRRQLMTLDLIYDSFGRKFKVEPWEVLSVEKFHWNGNLQVVLENGRFGYINAEDPWKINCYSPTGELEKVITS